jgi:hypothetical protein
MSTSTGQGEWVKRKREWQRKKRGWGGGGGGDILRENKIFVMWVQTVWWWCLTSSQRPLALCTVELSDREDIFDRGTRKWVSCSKVTVLFSFHPRTPWLLTSRSQIDRPKSPEFWILWLLTPYTGYYSYSDAGSWLRRPYSWILTRYSWILTRY